MKTIKLRLLLICLALAVSLNAQGKNLDEVFEGIKTIKAETVSSDMILKKSADDKVHLTLRVNFDRLENYEPIVEIRGDKLFIEEKFHGSTYSGNARWSLAIPNGTRVKFETASGDIKINDLNIDIETSIASGEVLVENCEGDFRLSTASGDVGLFNCKGQFDVECASGEIDLTNCEGEFDLSAASGNVRAEGCKGYFEMSVASGDVNAKNIELEGKSKFEAASGDVEIELGAAPEFDMILEVASGNAELYVPKSFSDVRVDLITREDDGRIITNFNVDEEETFSKKNRNHGGWGDRGRKISYLRQTINKNATKAKILVSSETGRVVLKSK